MVKITNCHKTNHGLEQINRYNNCKTPNDFGTENLQLGVVSLSVLKQISYKASLSRTIHSSAFSTSWWTDNVALYGSTTVSETFGEGNTEKVIIILSGYSSLIFDIKSVPIPDPVPPPREWHT
ncbi:hypothetical protein Hdeb2414_s0024g00651211 [Helianthus debilis subsp. tardiflorus]